MFNRKPKWIGMALASITTLTGCSGDRAAPSVTKTQESLPVISQPIQLSEPDQITRLSAGETTNATPNGKPDADENQVNVIRIDDEDEGTHSSRQTDAGEERTRTEHHQSAERGYEEYEDADFAAHDVDGPTNGRDVSDDGDEREDLLHESEAYDACEATLVECLDAIEEIDDCEEEPEDGGEDRHEEDGDHGTDGGSETGDEDDEEIEACFEAHRICTAHVDDLSDPLLGDAEEYGAPLHCETRLDACLASEAEEQDSCVPSTEDNDMTQECFIEFDLCTGQADVDPLFEESYLPCKEEWFACVESQLPETNGDGNSEDPMDIAMACDVIFDTCIDENEDALPLAPHGGENGDFADSRYTACEEAWFICTDGQAFNEGDYEDGYADGYAAGYTEGYAHGASGGDNITDETLDIGACDFQFDACIGEVDDLFDDDAHVETGSPHIEFLYLACDADLDVCLDLGSDEDSELACFDAHGQCIDDVYGEEARDQSNPAELNPCDDRLETCVDDPDSHDEACLEDWAECAGFELDSEPEYTDDTEM